MEQPLLSFAERISRERGYRNHRDRAPQGFFEKTPQYGDHAIREVVEASEASEAEKARNEDDDIRRLHPNYPPLVWFVAKKAAAPPKTASSR
jgi:hypothetical protein